MVLLLATMPSGTSWAGSKVVLPSGLYRLDMRQASTSKLPLLGRTRSAFVSVSLAELGTFEDGGTVLRQTHQICDVWFDTGFPLVEMQMPEPMRASLWRPTYEVQLERIDGRWRYRADFGVEHVGYMPEVGSEREKVPRKQDDPRVMDSDGDGRPGATLHLDVPMLDPLELHVVQRGHSILEGEVEPEGRVSGTIRVTDFEQRVIGAEPYFLKRSPKMKPDPERSHFTLTRVDPGTTCEALVDRGAPTDSETPQRELGVGPIETAAAP